MPGSDIFLSPEGARTIERLLGGFVDATGVQCVMVVSRSGQLLWRVGEVPGGDPEAVGALLVGVFNATQGLAGLVGEREFSTFFQEGEQWNIFYQLVEPGFVLASIFPSDVVLGVVKMESARLAPALSEEITRPAEPGFLDEWREAIKENDIFSGLFGEEG